MLSQSLVLGNPGNYYYNLDGMGEKWLWSGTFGGMAVFILPDGTLRRYDPAGTAAMLSDQDLLGRVDPAYFTDPSLLVGAPASGPAPATLTVSGTQLTVTVHLLVVHERTVGGAAVANKEATLARVNRAVLPRYVVAL